MKIAIIVLASMVLLTGMSAHAHARYANATSIYSNSHQTNKTWNDAWGQAWWLSGDPEVIGEDKALQNCRDTMMHKDDLFVSPGEYKVHLGDAKRDWDIMVNSKGNGQGSASCSKH